jgi:hypothetical protein
VRKPPRSDRPPLRVAYADPVYLGCGRLYDHPRAKALGSVAGQGARRPAVCEFPDGWALSLHSPSLRQILPLCPPDVRVAAWVKPFCVWKKGVNPVYGWEPVIFRGGRKRRAGVPRRAGLGQLQRIDADGAGRVEAGRAFCLWVFGLLGLTPADVLVDLFPGTRAVAARGGGGKREGAADAKAR